MAPGEKRDPVWCMLVTVVLVAGVIGYGALMAALWLAVRLH